MVVKIEEVRFKLAYINLNPTTITGYSINSNNVLRYPTYSTP
jgi:hypothetical protein